jgi:hypothetical protein
LPKLYLFFGRLGWTKHDIDNVEDMWDLLDVVTENAHQQQSQEFKEDLGSPQASKDKPVSEMTSQEKRDLIEKGKGWLEKVRKKDEPH